MSDVPQPLNRDAVLRGIWWANTDVVFSTAFAVFASGAFVIGFARLVGLNDFWLGVLFAAPSLVGIIQIPGSIWAERYEHRRKFLLPLAILSRCVWIVIATLPWWPASMPRGAILIMCFTASGIISALSSPPYLAWLSDLVSEKHRGWFFARRTSISAWVSFLIALPAGLLIDKVKLEAGPSAGYGTAYAIGVTFMLLSLGAFLKLPEPPRPTAAQRTLAEAKSSLRYAFKDRNFRRVVIFFLASAFGASFAGAFFVDYMLKELKMTFTAINILGAMTSITLIFSTKTVGYLCDRFGAKPIVVLSAILVMPLPFAWLLVVPGKMILAYIVLSVINILSGIGWGALGIAQTKLMVEAAPDEHRTVGVGTIASFSAVVAGAAPLISGMVMQSLIGVLGPTIVRYQILFVVTGLLRIITIIAATRVREVKSRSVRDLVQQLGGITPGGVMALRALGKKQAPEQREAAVEKLGQARMGMAIDELAHVLQDPQPSVRRKALEALSQIGGPRASQLLVDQLRQHPEDADEQLVEALAQVGDPDVINAVMPLLASPSPGLRLAAARALGSIGGPGAVEALTAAAEEREDPDLRRTAIRALGVAGAEESSDAIVGAVDAPEASVRLVAAEAVASLKLDDAAPLLRERLPLEKGTVAAEMAYALGSVGERNDLDLLLDTFARLEQDLPRQRAVLGIGRLLGVESQLYRLLITQGMELDATVLQVLRSAKRDTGASRRAAGLFADEDEAGALQALASGDSANPIFAKLAQVPSPEIFLVAVAVLQSEQ